MTTAFKRRRARLHALAEFRRAQYVTDAASCAAALARPVAGTERMLSLGVWAVLGAQFMGAFNDHFFKMVASLAAIEAGSRGEGTSAYLSLTGVLYVLPFLLFSGFAGHLADRFDKRTVIVATKGFEVVLGVLALGALMLSSIEAMLAVLFLFAAQSAFFSPSKYGVLPEIVPAKSLPRANGFMEFSRYLAIIGGTALAGILCTLWGRHSPGLGLVVLAVALLGWAASLGTPGGIPRLRERRRAGALVNWPGIKSVATHPRLRVLVCATTALDFTMTLLSMVVLLFAKQTMGLSDLESGLLVALAGIGVACGAVLAGALSRGRAEMGFLPIGAAGSSMGLILLSNSADSFAMAATALWIMGAFAGFLVVPLYTGLQQTAPLAERGRVIGANNFFNMIGVLAGSALLWVLRDLFDLQPRRILAGLALAVLAAGLAAMKRSPRLRTRVALLAAAAVECIHRIMVVAWATTRSTAAGARPRRSMEN